MMSRNLHLTRRRFVAVGAGVGAMLWAGAPRLAGAQALQTLEARLLAIGIPGAGAISPVGYFHPGGPIHDREQFAAYTAPGRILNAERVLVASEGGFGVPPAMPDWPSGSVLSLSASEADALVVPQDFAADDGQAVTLDGAVQLFTAQSPAFINALNNPTAVTAVLPSVGYPLGISLNNAFGRLWFANTPLGSEGAGVESICDVDGRPLAGAPSKVGGGVFAGRMTDRVPTQLISGSLDTGSVATALLGASPDGSGRAVFAVVGADGSVVQMHSEKGLDGLAPGGTIAPLEGLGPGLAATLQPVATRTGTVFNWVPNAILYIADPLRNAVVALTLIDDGQVFRVEETRQLSSPAFDVPIDLAPAVAEVASPAFSSNTTLAGGADLYVANRGDGTIVRLAQDGRVVAQRAVNVPGLGVLGAGRLNGIAVSPDAQRLWITVSGSIPGYEGLEGAIVEVPAFGTPNSRTA
jgi:hypothetical protein